MTWVPLENFSEKRGQAPLLPGPQAHLFRSAVHACSVCGGCPFAIFSLSAV